MPLTFCSSASSGLVVLSSAAAAFSCSSCCCCSPSACASAAAASFAASSDSASTSLTVSLSWLLSTASSVLPLQAARASEAAAATAKPVCFINVNPCHWVVPAVSYQQLGQTFQSLPGCADGVEKPP